MCERKVKLAKLLWCVFVLFSVVFLTCTLSVRFLIKSVKSNRTVKVHFQVCTYSSIQNMISTFTSQH
eukprot:UN21501